MRTVGPAAAAVALVLITGACSRTGERRVVAPLPSDPPAVTGMRWVWEPGALAGAVSRAGTSPLVQRALAEAAIPGIRARHDLAIRAVGVGPDGAPLGFTLLPYAAGGDPTHAVFVSVVEGIGAEGVEIAEMISGREPRANETGYEPVMFGGRLVWIRTVEAYVSAPTNPGDPDYKSAPESPVRRSFVKLFACLAERMPQGCAAGAAIADEIAPGVPRARAIGCGVGAAVGAGSCAADFVRNK